MFLLIILGITAGALVLRFSIVSKLDRLSAKLSEHSEQPAISRLLVELNMAESRFQQASNGGKAEDLDFYSFTLQHIFHDLDSISDHYLRGKTDTSSISNKVLDGALQQKLVISRQIFLLHHRFDSLLKLTSIKTFQRASLPVRTYKKVTADTTIQTKQESAKAGIITRLKSALRNRNPVRIMTIREKADQERILAKIGDRELLQRLSKQYSLLSKSNQELAIANVNLIDELRQMMKQLQLIDRADYEIQREQTLKEYQSATRQLNVYTGIAFSTVLLLILMLFVYIRRASFAEGRYKVANARAVTLAGQKSEILAIVSHEIRNKLMAINGALYMINKTSLSEVQDKKIKAIGLSSSMLLETVNNVLDISKLEQQSATIQRQEFSPMEAIIDSVEAMRFMAENKGVALRLEMSDIVNQQSIEGSTADKIDAYNNAGFDHGKPDDKLVKGNSIHLKQVVNNLLSNAIKYTDVGEVVVSAKLDQHILTVSVRDSGSGIPKNQQSKLFSAYYQPVGSKAGTGLGLYLCRQLVQLQGGTISLESDEGKGCTVVFSIPYDVK